MVKYMRKIILMYLIIMVEVMFLMIISILFLLEKSTTLT